MLKVELINLTVRNLSGFKGQSFWGKLVHHFMKKGD
jgi:hypothetical protein